MSRRILLAPMEGVLDWILRDLICEIGGVDQCVTEFIRVTHYLHNDNIFYHYAPELKTNSHTRTGVPLFVQLLGGQASPMGDNAAKAAELGACGIDLNFGCPAKTVNRHDGGATLLKYPERIFNIVSAVRKSVPQNIPVTAKLRLGFEDSSLLIDNALACEQAGAQWITLHCRTKMDGYKPPAHWHHIPPLQEKLKIPIVANGDIFSVEAFDQCIHITGSKDVMIGRGLIQDPYLAIKIKKNLPIENTSLDSWQDLRPRLPYFFQVSTDYKSAHFATSRTKQWLRQLSERFPEAANLFERLKILKDPQEFRSQLEALI